MSTVLPNNARILGTEGVIELPAPHHCPKELTVSRYNPLRPGLQQSHTSHAPIVGGGLRYEILEFHGLIEAGKPESSVMPLSDSLAIMRTLDLIRHQIHQPSQEDPHRES